MKRKYHHRITPCSECGQTRGRLHKVGCKYNTESMPDYRKYKGKRHLDDFRYIDKSLDKRIKLTEEQRDEIRELYFGERNQEHLYSTRRLAAMFNVSKRLIQFVLYPERKEKVAQRAKEVKRWTKHNKKELHTPAQQKHRAYKKELFEKDLLK